MRRERVCVCVCERERERGGGGKEEDGTQGNKGLRPNIAKFA